MIIPEHSMQLVENLRKFYEDESCFYVILVSRDGRQVRAHKVVLAAQSGYFRCMFRSEEERMIERSTMTLATLAGVVKFFYTCKMDRDVDKARCRIYWRLLTTCRQWH